MFPHQIEDVGDVENQDVIAHFTGRGDGSVRVGQPKYCLPPPYRDHAENYYNLQIREDDVWIVSFPRSGTTWTQEMVWLIMNDLDFDRARDTKPWERVIFIEVPVLFSNHFIGRLKELNKDDPEDLESIEKIRSPLYEKIQELPSPRIVKSHLPLSLLPTDLLSKAKVVYVARNPKDVAVSYFYHNMVGGIDGFEGTFEKYWDFFEKGLVTYGPQVPHVKEAWDARDNPNLMFLFYEDLQKDLRGMIKKVSAFLNKTLTDEQVDKLENYLSFDNMKTSSRMGRRKDKKYPTGLFKPGPDFYRRGKVGGNSEYDEKLNTRANQWIAEQSRLYGVTFPANEN